MSGAPTGSVIGNANSSAGLGCSSNGGAGANANNLGPHPEGGGGAVGESFDIDPDKADVESIFLHSQHSWWNIIALCKRVFK